MNPYQQQIRDREAKRLLELERQVEQLKLATPIASEVVWMGAVSFTLLAGEEKVISTSMVSRAPVVYAAPVYIDNPSAGYEIKDGVSLSAGQKKMGRSDWLHITPDETTQIYKTLIVNGDSSSHTFYYNCYSYRVLGASI